MQSYLPAHLAARRSGSLTATLTTYLKIAKFLEYAANATEQIIARADDDVWLSTSTLEAYASALLDGVQQRVISRAFIAGVFEYANWIADKLLATGWATTAPWARRAGNLINGNCSLDPSLPPSRCFGPFAFPKGPLMLISREAVRRLVYESFRSDVLAAPTRHSQLNHSMTHDDIQLGAWLAQLTTRSSERSNQLREHTAEW